MAFLTLTPENPDFCCSPLFSLGRVSNRLRAVVNREGLPVASEAGAHTRGSRTVAAVAVGVDGHFETLGQLFPPFSSSVFHRPQEEKHKKSLTGAAAPQKCSPDASVRPEGEALSVARTGAAAGDGDKDGGLVVVAAARRKDVECGQVVGALARHQLAAGRDARVPGVDGAHDLHVLDHGGRGGDGGQEGDDGDDGELHFVWGGWRGFLLVKKAGLDWTMMLGGEQRR